MAGAHHPWQRIDEPNVYGYVTEHDGIRIEAIRHYAGDWHLYCYRDGAMMRTQDDERFASSTDAKRRGIHYLTCALTWNEHERQA